MATICIEKNGNILIKIFGMFIFGILLIIGMFSYDWYTSNQYDYDHVDKIQLEKDKIDSIKTIKEFQNQMVITKEKYDMVNKINTERYNKINQIKSMALYEFGLIKNKLNIPIIPNIPSQKITEPVETINKIEKPGNEVFGEKTYTQSLSQPTQPSVQTLKKKEQKMVRYEDWVDEDPSAEIPNENQEKVIKNNNLNKIEITE